MGWKSKNVFKILFLVILLGLFLRVYSIGNESFWIDEAATVYTLQQKPSNIIHDVYSTTVIAPKYFKQSGQSPFYYVVANYWNRLVGLSEARLRLLSAIFGVVSIYIIFLIGKMIFDYRAGLISAFLLSINYLHVWYSQEARSYSLGILLTLLTVFFLLNALRKQNVQYWLSYILSAALLIYTHFFGFFILVFEYLFLLLFWKSYRKSLKQIIISGICIFVLYLPWIPAVLRQIGGSRYLTAYLGQNVIYDFSRIFVQFNSWFTPDIQTRTALKAVYHSIGNYAKSNLSSITAISWLTITSVLFFTALLVLRFVRAIFVKNKKVSLDNIKDKKYIFLLMWFLLPLLIPMIITIISPGTPAFGFVQYVIFASPAYYLIVSKGIIESKKYVSVLVTIAIFSLLPLYSHYANFDKQQWREVANYLHNNRAENDILIVNPAGQILALDYYYKAKNILGVNDIAELATIIDKKDSFWFIYSSEQYWDPKGVIKDYLDKNYEIRQHVEFTGVRIFYYVQEINAK